VPWRFLSSEIDGEALGWIGFCGGALPEATDAKALARLAALILREPTANEQALQQLTRFSILMEIGRVSAEKLELEPLLETVYREVGRSFDTTNFYIALCRAGVPEWIWAYHIERGVREAPTRHPIGIGFTGYLIRMGQPVLLNSVAGIADFVAARQISVVGEGPKSWMGVPLIAGESVVGVMAIQNYERENVYTPDDLELFSAIASQIAIAVRNAQLYEDAERRAREMEALVAIGRDITSSLDLETVLGRIASSVRTLLTKDSLAIFLGEEGGTLFNAVAVSGLMAEPLQATTVTRGEGILGSIIQNGVAEVIQDTITDARAIHIEGTEDEEKGEKLMAAPLMIEDKVIGVIAVWRKTDEAPFGLDDLTFFETIARQASVAIRNARLFGQSRAAQAEAEKANLAKSSFLASMSHELRTPLNAILLYSELLTDELRERGIGELTSDIGKIQSAGRHLLGLIDDILDLSKIEAGRMTVFLEDCPVPSLLAEISMTIEPLVARNRNRLVVDADPLIQVIHSDQKKLRQTIYNLLSNAAKFTKEGTINLKVDQDPADRDRARFIVSDTGIGMTQEQMSRLFQEFSQAEESTSRNYGGTGLGLTLCRKFMNLLGGDIRVESTPGIGTSFIISVPGLQAPLVPAAPSEVCGKCERGTVLVIDDDVSLLGGLSKMLSREGFKVFVAGNGAEGLALARSVSPRIITLDLAMPGLNGWEVLAQLKADPDLKRIPVVVITILEDQALGFPLEAAEYLQKPVSREQLMAAIAHLLPEGRNPSALIVEDDEATREGLRRILANEGLQIQCARDGLKALECLKNQRPDLILLDLMMPEMDGFQLMEEIRRHEDWQGIPVVVLTAAELTEPQRQSLRDPQIQQIIKKGSYTRHELVEVVRKFALQRSDP
jgi:signal transduction histidine kinase/CheY-like chemotaxis protein